MLSIISNEARVSIILKKLLKFPLLLDSHLLKDGAVSEVHSKGGNAMETGHGKKSGWASKKGKRNVQPLQSSMNVVQ